MGRDAQAPGFPTSENPQVVGYVREFFTNWREYDGPFSKKVRLTLRNRWRSVATLKGCCGHHGEPNWPPAFRSRPEATCGSAAAAGRARSDGWIS